MDRDRWQNTQQNLQNKKKRIICDKVSFYILILLQQLMYVFQKMMFWSSGWSRELLFRCSKAVFDCFRVTIMWWKNTLTTNNTVFHIQSKTGCETTFINVWTLNLLAPELFFQILAHPVYKMWIKQEPNMSQLWNKLHFEEKKTESIYHV